MFFESNLIPSSENSKGFSLICCVESESPAGDFMTKACGTVDIVNHHTGGGLRRRHPAPRTPKWNKSHLKYEYITGFPEAAKLPVENAIKKWEGQMGFTFSRSSPADVKIGFHRGSHGDGYPFDGGDVLAHAFLPPDGRLHFDGDQLWSCLRRGGGEFFDLESVALHELGHVLGLRHSLGEEDVMYHEIAPGKTKQHLTANDVEALRRLYS